MKIGLLSFVVDKEHPERTRGHEQVILDILRALPELDMLVTAGWTLFSQNELDVLLAENLNQHTAVILETWTDIAGNFDHKGYAIQGNRVLVSRTPQVFASSSDVNRNPKLLADLLDLLETERCLHVAGRCVTWLICGEINVLANVQSEGNRAEFRFAEEANLADRWHAILNRTDIFVDPTHTVMGNQGKLHKRRELLSAGGRIFCSVSNVDTTGRDAGDAKRRLGQKPVQYLYLTGMSQALDTVMHEDGYVLRTYSTGS